MQKQNRAALVLLGLTWLLILLGCVNSVVGQYESFFISLLFSSSWSSLLGQFERHSSGIRDRLDSRPAGETAFGHAFALATFHLISRTGS